jgi:hypothetical protein
MSGIQEHSSRDCLEEEVWRILDFLFDEVSVGRIGGNRNLLFLLNSEMESTELRLQHSSEETGVLPIVGIYFSPTRMSSF